MVLAVFGDGGWDKREMVEKTFEVWVARAGRGWGLLTYLTSTKFRGAAARFINYRRRTETDMVGNDFAIIALRRGAIQIHKYTEADHGKFQHLWTKRTNVTDSVAQLLQQ